MNDTVSCVLDRKLFIEWITLLLRHSRCKINKEVKVIINKKECANQYDIFSNKTQDAVNLKNAIINDEKYFKKIINAHEEKHISFVSRKESERVSKIIINKKKLKQVVMQKLNRKE